MRFGPPEALRSQLMLLGCGSSGSGMASNSVEAQAYFDRLIPYPSSAREVILGAFIDALVAAGIDQCLDGLFINCHKNAGSALTNVFSSNYQGRECKNTAGLTHTADLYFSGGSVGHHVNTGLLIDSLAHYSRDDAMMGLMIVDGAQVSQSALYVATDAAPQTPLSNIDLTHKWSGGQTFFNINEAGYATTSYTGDSSGLFIMQRTSSTASALYRNDALVHARTSNSTALPANAYLRFRCAHKTALMFAGKSLSGAQRTAFYNAATTLITDMGGHPA